MNTTIVHLSDTHFSNPDAVRTPDRLLICLIDFLKKLEKPSKQVVLVLSGDITFQAQERGYEDARVVLDGLVSKNLIDRKNIILCPGNHDLNSKKNGKWFDAFDAFSSAARGDKQCTFSEDSVRVVAAGELDFVVMNSSFNGNYKFGFCDISSLKDKLLELEPSKRPRVCVIHHNLLNRFEEDTSTLRNAYLLIENLDGKGFRLVLHGHQHADLGMQLGNDRFMVSGVGSLNYLAPAFLNGFATFHFQPAQVVRRRYALTDDSPEVFQQIAESKILEY